MSGTPRTAGYVVLTCVAAVLELVGHGWHETRADDEAEPGETRPRL